ncbi:sodium-dependent glucose transporter 1 [Nephila pilipes]|uniref:Sodium-dependent glucose transporter 1 n=1 Tax=Nephila pilipes TaxID=299642 RepID=A0A8X6QFS7_NEPPI|nr:sodium-dependent glucose transporter 1 [Nephila pilipes]
MLTRKQIVLTMFNFFSALTMLAIPWSRSISVLTALMVGNGLSLGVLDTGGNVCCLNIWGKDSGPIYQALHFIFGLGGLIGPLVAAPFVGHYVKLESSNEFEVSTNTSSIGQSLANNSFLIVEGVPPVTYAFTAIGCFALLVTVLFLVVCIISPVDNQEQQDSSAQVRERSLSFILLIVFLNIVLVFVETGTEVGYAQMLASYVVKGPLKLTPTIGSYMTSAYWAAFSVSRFASVFLAIFFSNLQLIVFDVVVSAIGAAVLVFFGASNEWAMWLATILLGVGIASFFPSAIGWIESYITVTNKMASSFCVGAAFGQMLIPYIIGSYIEEMPDILIYIEVASCVLSAAIVLIMWLILRKKKEKYIKNKGIVNVAYDSNITN